MRVANFTIEFGGTSETAPHEPIWAYDHDDTDKAWQLIRRRGLGSYAEGPFRQNLVLEETELPSHERRLIDAMPHLEWVAWAAKELRGILDGEGRDAT